MTLFTVGPVEMDAETRQLGGQALPYFRTAEFSNKVLELEANLKALLGTAASSKVALLTASGTAGMEAAVMNVFTDKDRVIVVNGGGFGARFSEMLAVQGVPYTELKLAFGEVLTAAHFDAFEGGGYTGLLVNLHETTTGQLYPIELISRFAKSAGLTLVVDAISTFLADPYYMDEWGIDVSIVSSHKGLALPPAISAVVVNEKTWLERVRRAAPPCLYFRLADYFDNIRRGQTPYTPAVGVLLQMHQRLLRLRETGLPALLDRVGGLAEDFRRRLRGLPNFRLPDYPLSNALTPVICLNQNAQEVFRRALAEASLVLTPAGGEMADFLLRVGHLGELQSADNERLIQFLDSFATS
ncbi:hypothetical protein CAI21_11835 [Alkalilimnicola ehrlichii]|uniref:Aminotransferase class V domain-containing protein n=1 Tax=Alkalilimnicola ehrlichii TaxID=351052 RepID=A0A3E0WUQ8_9GAMM|nr:aminotransferase class V-fold PLP-dependent enzyme [Alkalilimnicola ehrlichii]RFA28551.1 hypothetical protein CAI21_11835 [Alkalilimnicola ehrlichii]RFA35715.1 hypothetical protein CAL65_12355 [Alkalilimnicola ehrlichii]